MARSILEIAKEVCDRALTNSPTSLFENNDRSARILRVAAKDTIRDLMRDAMKNGATPFRSQWAFATRPNVYAYELPPDFFKIIPGTEQRDRYPLGILGPVSPQTWSNWITGMKVATVPMGWQIKNNLIWFEPTPAEAELVVIEYLSSWPVARDATDADLENVNGYLTPIEPFVPRDGYITAAAMNALESQGGSKWGEAEWGTAVWGTLPHEQVRRIPTTAKRNAFPAYQVRAPEFTTDTDTTAFGNDDHLLSLGMTWRLKKGLNMPYAEERDEYEREKGVFLANDGSRGRTINLERTSVLHAAEPLGGGRWSVE